MKYIPIYFDDYLRSRSQEGKAIATIKTWLENNHLRIKIDHLDYIDYGYGGHFFPLDAEGRKLHPMNEEEYLQLDEGDRRRMKQSQAN